jgi:hypothetical protein
MWYVSVNKLFSRESAMPNVAEVIRDHVTLAVECVDRLYLNAYVPGLQRGPGVVAFLRQRGQVIASPALFGEITNIFKAALGQYCSTRKIPWIEFTKGQAKDQLVETYRQQFTADEGVVLVGVAQEKAKAWAGTKKVDGRRVHFTFNWHTVYVNHYYIYLIDRNWGPAFIKVCGYAPYAVKVCLNAHEWAKRQAQRRGIPCEALDNGFLACADPASLQAICDSLSADDIQDFFDRWVGSLPLPLSADDAASGFSYRLSILQMEVSLTQVFDDPVRGREFFEEVIRDNLDLGRPDRVQLLVDRKVMANTPSRFSTCVITDGILPSLHVEYKRCHIKQYFKRGRALRTETTFNNTYDFRIGRGLSNFAHLRTVGRRINWRLLHLERTAHDCGLSQAKLSALTAPSRTAQGQPAPALKLGDPRVTALLGALCLFVLTPEGITNRRLRPQVAQLLGVEEDQYTARQMGYDLRRLKRKGLIQPVGRQLCYTLTPQGRRVALFLTKVHARILRPGFQALDLRITSEAPPPLRMAYAALDTAIQNLTREAKLAA